MFDNLIFTTTQYFRPFTIFEAQKKLGDGVENDVVSKFFGVKNGVGYRHNHGRKWRDGVTKIFGCRKLKFGC